MGEVYEPGYWLTRLVFQRPHGGRLSGRLPVRVVPVQVLCGERGLLPAPRLLAAVGVRGAPSLS